MPNKPKLTLMENVPLGYPLIYRCKKVLENANFNENEIRSFINEAKNGHEGVLRACNKYFEIEVK